MDYRQVWCRLITRAAHPPMALWASHHPRAEGSKSAHQTRSQAAPQDAKEKAQSSTGDVGYLASQSEPLRNTPTFLGFVFSYHWQIHGFPSQDMSKTMNTWNELVVNQFFWDILTICINQNGGSMHPQMIGHSTTRSRPKTWVNKAGWFVDLLS